MLKTNGPDDDDAAFDEGLAAAGEGDGLAARLFTVRARVVAGGARAESTPSYLSGLLIGAEVASVPKLLGAAPEQVVLLGDASLCARYRRAMVRTGIEVESFDGEAAAIAGLFALGALHDPR